jgi:hypothetical protein
VFEKCNETSVNSGDSLLISFKFKPQTFECEFEFDISLNLLKNSISVSMPSLQRLSAQQVEKQQPIYPVKSNQLHDFHLL